MKKNLILFFLISNFIQAKVIQTQKTKANKQTQKASVKRIAAPNIGATSHTHFPTQKPQQTHYPSQSIHSNLSANIAKQAAKENKSLNKKRNKGLRTLAIPIPIPIAVPVATTTVPQTAQQTSNVQPALNCADGNLNVTAIEVTQQMVKSALDCPTQCAIEYQGSCYNSIYDQLKENVIACGCGILENYNY